MTNKFLKSIRVLIAPVMMVSTLESSACGLDFDGDDGEPAGVAGSAGAARVVADGRFDFTLQQLSDEQRSLLKKASVAVGAAALLYGSYWLMQKGPELEVVGAESFTRQCD